jgi:hypothetical protein
MEGEVERDFIWDTQIFCKDKTIEHVTKKKEKKNLNEKYLKRGKKMAKNK